MRLSRKEKSDQPAVPKSGGRQVAELIATLIAALAAAYLCQSFLVKPYQIPSGSMLPTLHINQRVLVWRAGGDPQVGDIVVFHPPSTAEHQPSPLCGAPGQGVDPGGTPYQTPCSRPTSAPSSQVFIKRVVAVGGDTIAIRGGHVILNGKPEPDSYIAPCDPGDPICTFAKPITIPPGYFFMMGDNRADSDDSRYWGPVPRKWLIGTQFATYWPLNRIGLN